MKFCKCITINSFLLHHLVVGIARGYAFMSLQHSNRLLSTMSKRQGHLNACFIRVSFCVFITHFAKEEVKQNDQGWFSVNIKPSITSCFDVLKPYHFYTKHKYLHLLRLVNHCASIVTETIKTSCPLLRDLPYSVECNIKTIG